MLTRRLNEVQLRKSVLVERSQAWRRDFDRELEPVHVWVDKAEQGFNLARQGRDLLLVLAPVLVAMVKGKGGVMKGAMGLISNWPVLKGVWEGFRAMRQQSRETSSH